MALKLHQDHFAAADVLEDPPTSLFDRITTYETNLFISHENDPEWRKVKLGIGELLYF